MHHLSGESLERLMMRPTECCDDGSSIEEKIELACRLHTVWGVALRRNPYISELLEKLDQNLRTSKSAMLDLGIVKACKRCDEEEGGSCCGAGLENKFDSFLLLINLLLGVSLPERYHRPGSCYLLSDQGCILKVRLILCVDYLCPKFMSALSHDKAVTLQRISGDELATGFRLYDAMKRFMRNNAGC